ncbi:MAG: nucleoside triphosphate pyrophosphohydrolase [Candidatus Kapaibacterium sp.]
MEEKKQFNKPPLPKDPKNPADQFEAFLELVRVLRRDCPWDRKQTNESIAPLMIEETYEALEAIENKDDDEFSKELGDLLLHVVMHAVMAEERGAFNINDVMTRSRLKLVNRHPHVFGDVEVTGSENVVRNWEAIKMTEGRKSILEGVPKAMPALLRAERIQHKVSKVGFDWTEKSDVWDKVGEELGEFRQESLAGNRNGAADELGDLLFSIVNAARFDGLVPEESLQRTNNKFSRRFEYIERKAIESGKKLSEMTLGEMDELWNEAKELE